ncbi:MAG: hypothetical protein CH6_2359 [Candidatus Kapaibacterium sp.]|nr:MAG: hypothetical protein CH6_2359 [Candidatus Kapabacteria bacterium]
MTKYFCLCFSILLFLSGTLIAKSNDDAIQTQLLVVPSKPSSNEPINFNFVRVGNSKSKNFYIENAGTNSYTINRILFQNGGLGVFFFVSTPTVPTIIQPNESLFIYLTFQPDRIGSFYDTLLIYFSEPFNFIYSLPVEGHSSAYNLIFGKDTSDFIGTSIFKVPFFIQGDPNLVTPITTNISLSLTTNAKVFFIDSISNGSITARTTNGPFVTYSIKFNNIILDSSLQFLFYAIGRLFLSEPDTTLLTINDVKTDEQGLFFELKQTRVQAYGICISNLSLIELNLNFVKVDIPSTVVSENLTLNFTKQTNSRENFVLKIYNILGKLIFETEEPITDQVSLPLSFISSGIYKVEILIKNQKYSKIISVIN